MSNLPISSPYRSTPDAVVSDLERDQLASRLNAAFTAGALSQEDYSSRLDRLFAAKVMGELVPVVENLPPLQTYSAPAMVQSNGGQPGQLTPSRNGNRLAVVAGGTAIAVLLLVVILLVLLL